MHHLCIKTENVSCLNQGCVALAVTINKAYLIVVQDCSHSGNELASLDKLEPAHVLFPVCTLLLCAACGIVLPQLDLQYRVSEESRFELKLSRQPVATQVRLAVTPTCYQ